MKYGKAVVFLSWKVWKNHVRMVECEGTRGVKSNFQFVFFCATTLTIKKLVCWSISGEGYIRVIAVKVEAPIDN